MSSITRPPRQIGRFTLGRKNFAKISAVEGIELSEELEATFREFDAQNLSVAERRHRIVSRYSRKS